MTQARLIFLIGAPRSGTTLLARMMGAHSLIHSCGEPHLINPIAHLGYYAQVQKAPYDALLAERAIQEFVTNLPRGEDDYLDALRAYTDTLYDRTLARMPDKEFFLDKTPAYALVLPFLTRLYPGAHYVVLTRHPLAVFTSYVQTFFAGDYRWVVRHQPVLSRYVPVLARMLREQPVPFVHVRYEDLVCDPETHFRRVCDHLDIPFEAAAIAYGENCPAPKGLGDPTGIARHTRPVRTSASIWAAEIASNDELLKLVSGWLDELDPSDLATLGYPRDQIVADLEAARGTSVPLRRMAPMRYALERNLLMWLRRHVHHNRLGSVIKRLHFALGVVLKD